MKIVIDIPEEHYEYIKNLPHYKRNYEQDLIIDVTSLPKGHGRLIDADELLKAIDTWDKFGVDANQKIVHFKDCYVPYVHYEDMVKSVSGAETIIPADKEEEE